MMSGAMAAGQFPPQTAYGALSSQMMPCSPMGSGIFPHAGLAPGTALGSMAPASRPPAVAQPAVPYEVVRRQVTERLDQSMQKRHELIGHLDEVTEGEYSEHMKNTFSAARRARLDDVDWRVPRLMYCKDPKHNVGLDPLRAQAVQERKMADGRVLEDQLAAEAHSNWERALEVVDRAPPPEELVRQRPVPFVEAAPNYQAEEDVWARTLELRTLDEAMRGDVSKPMPRPALHNEDYANFHEGKYLKDDCPIA
uniref:Uncharacterized protein n=1 Tax=Zooxanthella nutricula TaxID=1333877 RepID=A0A7S2VRG3_9DINO